MAIIYGPKIAFGCYNPLPLSGFPLGRARIKMRHNEFVTVAVKSPDGVKEFYVLEQDGKWIPFREKTKTKYHEHRTNDRR